MGMSTPKKSVMKKQRVEKYEITSTGADIPEVIEKVSMAHAKLLAISAAVLVAIYEDTESDDSSESDAPSDSVADEESPGA